MTQPVEIPTDCGKINSNLLRTSFSLALPTKTGVVALPAFLKPLINSSESSFIKSTHYCPLKMDKVKN